MKPRFRFDSEDPFGTRPDEKPPEGWDTRFWEGVRERIEDRRNSSEPPGLPEPPRRGAPARTAAIVAMVAMVALAAAMLLSPGPPTRALAPEDPSSTVVRVSGVEDPSVAVEWARSGGRSSGYVVLQSLEPDISYVVIDRKLANP
jgi:hypothetical protein